MDNPRSSAKNHRNLFKTLEPGLTGIGTQPEFAIGQRALLIQFPQCNVLWDCIPLLDDETISLVKALGGISVIAILHPHYFSTMIEWGKEFNAPVFFHARNLPFVAHLDPIIDFWDCDVRVFQNGFTLICTGGQFPGSTVLQWQDGAGGKGALLSGDSVTVAQDRKVVSFISSYPNLVSLSPHTVRRIAASIEPYFFGRVYAAWWHMVIEFD